MINSIANRIGVNILPILSTTLFAFKENNKVIPKYKTRYTYLYREELTPACKKVIS